MLDIDPAPRLLGFMLGLGDLNAPQPCMSYANGCFCPVCSDRADCEERLRDLRREKAA